MITNHKLLVEAIRNNVKLIEKHCAIPGDSFLNSLFSVIFDHLCMLDDGRKLDIQNKQLHRKF